ncbi:uncharacterized protein EV420DRAFT_1496666 [Desarmillaria tabescens]|uniref:GPI anchored protein n=1 Tax=Armillaria tabescens TaxID=1929756 RepID=A0AA39NQ96_ARMTA|nr:uncharacterized protein EV420DRAFT_1496666 [Desarmillaria tabescens]KAK0469806.1 hypothetical protein EV420DRAFT_1496666 [Desarmillaria tabescens]
MKFSLFSLSAVFALIGSALAQGDLTINTPSGLTQCLPTLLSWTGGTGMIIFVLGGRRLTITSGTDPNGNALANLGEQSGTSLTWTVTFPQGTALVFNVRDQTGAVKQTAPVTVQTGGSTDCASSTSGASGSSTSGATDSTTAGATTGTTTSAAGATTSTSPAGASTSRAATSGASTSSRASSAAGSGTSAGASASASSSGNAAPSQFSSMGAAGVIGAAIVALFA